MRKSPLIALGLVAAMGTAGTVAVAQENTDPGHTLQVSVAPSNAKAGTKKKPKTITKVKFSIANNKASGTTASTIEIKFPKTIKFNAKGFKTCSVATLENDGPDACPSKSKLGSGTAAAVVNPRSATPAPLNFKNTFYIGGANQLNIYLEQTGGDVRRVLVGKLGNGGGKYGKKITIAIPEDLQQPAPGVYSALTDIAASLGATTGSGKKKHGYFQSTGCIGGQYDFQSRITYVPNPDPPKSSSSQAEDTVACKK